MKNYEKRKNEECEKFAKKYNINYEDVMDLIIWVEWTASQKVINGIIQNLKGYIINKACLYK